MKTVSVNDKNVIIDKDTGIGVVIEDGVTITIHVKPKKRTLLQRLISIFKR